MFEISAIMEKLSVITKLKTDFVDEEIRVLRRSGIMIKEFDLIKKMRNDFDSYSYKSLTIKTIKEHYPEFYHSDMLHTASIIYFLQRIITHAHEIDQTPIFYQNVFSKDSTFIHEQNDFYFFVENKNYSFVKTMLSVFPVVKLKRIFSRNKKIVEVYAFKNGNKIKKDNGKVCDKRNKKRLKIKAHQYVYVKKNSFELAKKALSPCFVTLYCPRKIEQERKKINVPQKEIEQSQFQKIEDVQVKEAESFPPALEERSQLMVNEKDNSALPAMGESCQLEDEKNVHPSMEEHSCSSETQAIDMNITDAVYQVLLKDVADTDISYFNIPIVSDQPQQEQLGSNFTGDGSFDINSIFSHSSTSPMNFSKAEMYHALQLDPKYYLENDSNQDPQNSAATVGNIISQRENCEKQECNEQSPQKNLEQRKTLEDVSNQHYEP